MKKFFALALSMSMMLSMAACGSSGSSSSSSSAAASDAGTAASSAAPDTAAKPDKVYTLKISTTQNETAPIVKGLQAIADAVAEETNGGLNLEIYPAGQLGVEEDMIEQALQGVNVAVLTDAARMSNYVNDIGIMNMAYIVDNYDEAVKIMETETFKGWEAGLVDNGIRVLAFNFYDGARSFMTHKEVKAPADLKGQRIRTPGAPVWVNSIESLGATPISMAWGEVYNGIQSNALDGCEVQFTSAYSTRIFEVCKFINKTEHIQLVNCLVTGEKWFSTLPEEYQNILVETSKACAYDNAKYVEGLVQEIEGKLVAEGMTVVDVDKEAFKAAAEKAYEKMGWVDLRAQLYKEIGKA